MYWSQVLLSRDDDFKARIAAAFATQGVPSPQPETWAHEHVWQIAAAPTFAEKYQYALETGVENPGRDAAVITDADLLAAVQAEITRWSTS